MSRISYVNGRYIPHREAAVSIDDRGYHFADAIYEVLVYFDGRMLDATRHLSRLRRSLRELALEFKTTDAALSAIFAQVIRRNRYRHGTLYIQISRGVAARDHAFPSGAIEPALVVSAKPLDLSAVRARQEVGVGVVTMPETRWSRPDIKSTSLLANVLAKQAAHQKGAAEGWFVDADGMITEGTSSSSWIVNGDRQIITRSLDGSILPGVTRTAVLDVARAEGLELVERAFSADEASSAAEAFLTSTTNFVMPVVSIDNAKVGDGHPGPVTSAIIKAHWDHVRRETGCNIPAGG